MTFEEWFRDNADLWKWRLASPTFDTKQQTEAYEACRRAAMCAWHDGRREGWIQANKAGVRNATPAAREPLDTLYEPTVAALAFENLGPCEEPRCVDHDVEHWHPPNAGEYPSLRSPVAINADGNGPSVADLQDREQARAEASRMLCDPYTG